MTIDSGLLVKYYRLSLEDDNDGESGSIGNQRKIIEDYVKGDLELAVMQNREFVDDGYTGANFNRPGIQQVLELLRQNQVACIVVKDFSRFTRDYIELGSYLEQILPFMEVRFISVNDGYDSRDGIRARGMEIPFRGLLNNLYSQDLSVKVRAAKRQQIKQGKLCSGSYPFGYRKNKNREPIYCIDEPAAETIRLIFNLAVQGKKNIEIARTLNERKLPTPAVYKRQNGGTAYGLGEGKSSNWDSQKILLILRDERYQGTLIIGRYQSAGVGSGKVIEAPKHMWYRKEQAIPAIVSAEEFAKVQGLRSYQKRGSYNKEHHILYRKVKCGCCGRYLYFKPSESGVQYNRFFCKQSHLDLNSKCFRGYIKEKEILDTLLVLLRKQTAVYHDEKKAAVKSRRDNEDKKKLVLLEREMKCLKAKRLEDYQQYQERIISKAEFLAGKAEVWKKMEYVESEISKIKRAMTMEQAADIQAASLCRRGWIEKLDRGLIEMLVDTVWIYDGDRIKVDLKFGD